MVKATKKAITTATALHALLAADQGGNSSDVAPLLDEAVKLQRDLGEVCAQNIAALNEKRAPSDASVRNVAAVSGDNVVPLTAILGASTPTASDGLVEGGA